MRKGYLIVLFIALALALLATLVLWQFNRTLSNLHIEQLDYHIERVNFHEIQFSHFSFVQTTENTEDRLKLRGLHIRWQWPRPFGQREPGAKLLLPSLKNLNLEEAYFTRTLIGQPTSTSNKVISEPFDLPKTFAIPSSFPESIQIQRLIVKLPTETGTISLAGIADLLSTTSPDASTMTVNLQASSGETLDAEHQLALKAIYTFSRNALTGKLLLAAKTSTPIAIPNLGHFSGEAAIDIDINEGKLVHHAFSSAVNADQLKIPNAWKAMGINVDSLKLDIRSQDQSEASSSRISAEFSAEFLAKTHGAMQTQATGALSLDLLSKKLMLEKLVLSAKIPEFNPLPDLKISDLQLDLTANGQWHINEAANAALHIDSQASLSLGKVTHAHIKNLRAQKKPWRWNGNFHGSPSHFDLTGDLKLGASLTIKHQAMRKPSELLVKWQMPDIFLLAANPFADLLNAWPPLLTLNRGKINAKGDLVFNVEKNQLVDSKSEIQLLDITGVYDTITFQGLNSNVSVNTIDKTLGIATDEFKVEKIDKGFVVGPLAVAAKYTASLTKPLAGKLNLAQFNCVAMEGNMRFTPHEFDFSHATQQLLLSLHDINLATLLLQYPSSELSGSGKLSGTVPIEISGTGIRIAKGVVSAEVPGGKLVYKSERATAIAKTQPNMKLITEALNDFHYSLLSSQINYDEKGKLLLSVRLEGQNPALENGRPVNFNVNLEEDVPAMLASIQLSSKVTDVVKKRLQERMKKKSRSDAVP